jgi:hypothetical protein
MGGILSEPAIFSGVQVLSTRHRLTTLFCDLVQPK